jgi:hypothetical protein
VNSVGRSPPCVTKRITVAKPPLKPAPPRCIVDAKGAVNVSWDAARTVTSHAVLGYRLLSRPADSDAQFTVLASLKGKETSTVVTTLGRGQAFDVKVCSGCLVGSVLLIIRGWVLQADLCV